MSFGMVAASYLGVIDDEIPAPMLAVAFNEGSGTTFAPTIGSGTGTITPGYGQWIPGPVSGTALGRYMTGPADYDPNPCALLTDISGLDTASWTGMTVMAWVKLHMEATAPRWPLLLMHELTYDNGWLTADGGWMGWQVPYGSDGVTSYVNGVAAFVPDVVAEDTWVHLCTTWDGTTQRLYANGVLAASAAVAGPLYNTVAIAIGSIHHNYGAAGVDDLRIYNQALTETQITTLMGVAV